MIGVSYALTAPLLVRSSALSPWIYSFFQLMLVICSPVLNMTVFRGAGFLRSGDVGPHLCVGVRHEAEASQKFAE